MKDKLKKWCEAYNIEVTVQEIPYGEKWILKKLQDQVHFNFYDSGKHLLQGKDSAFKRELEALFDEEKPKSNITGDILGSDESGKGDYFGPLVVASFLLEEKHEKEILRFGVKDSKKLNDTKILEIAEKLKHFPHAVIVLSPTEYNFIYDQTKNLNTLLAKLHGDAIKSLLKKHKVDQVVIDQFAADASVITKHFKGLEVKVSTQFRAEEIPAVACASILARAYFVKGISEQEKKYGQSFPKGASLEVEMAAEYFIKKYGVASLSEVAKLHFVTTQKIVQPKLNIE